ncbi:NupC/NupG family nucleoside CNT transporter [Helicobacter pylori]|uniref:NupC/NupG family nucleoside CNT transporter n=1 Tax=Helicobacter pylori TaxID=210 RepID=UPI00026A193B|nr:NupC/NupG family nucleoside CNT transporter [Helicobacter pylori]EJC11994.1 nucleoside transporter, NupC family protein [Helicobacter pylori Hp P-25]EJB47677.1 nucleoside permease [Helicobacter pylori Hp H-16]EJC33248.1 nucleoside transporter, NupC family protein [Helicobacter pylori Hp P-25c]EJC38985.1 nucleoside transporter, NupC family protein [Helicobacter pylori Hp P-25d]EMH11107.1 nucleoside transporter, NupC family [Helicobacter pylori GAM246Ai]
MIFSSLFSVVGMAVLFLIAWVFSGNKRAINYRTIVSAFVIQVALGALALYVPLGREILQGLASGIQSVIGYGYEGVRFLFGNLAPNAKGDQGIGGFIFAINVLAIIIFFASLISLLYYLKIMPLVINLIGGALQKCLGTSKAESMSAAANIFVAHTEAPLVIKPYLKSMSDSEIFAVMCVGMASVAGPVLAGYASMGIPLPYLIAASFMSAPGGLLFAKIIYPQNETTSSHADVSAEEHVNIIEAIANGASTGLHLALHVGAMLLAFVGMLALINGLLGVVGGFLGMEHLSLGVVLGTLLKPLAFMLGIPWSQAGIAGEIIGIKIALNEFVGYIQLLPYLGDNPPLILSEKTKAIITFALCGFANLSSVAMLIGGLGSLVPKKKDFIAKLALKAVLVGTLSNFMSATIAGLFIGLSAN